MEEGRREGMVRDGEVERARGQKSSHQYLQTTSGLINFPGNNDAQVILIFKYAQKCVVYTEIFVVDEFCIFHRLV